MSSQMTLPSLSSVINWSLGNDRDAAPNFTPVNAPMVLEPQANHRPLNESPPRYHRVAYTSSPSSLSRSETYEPPMDLTLPPIREGMMIPEGTGQQRGFTYGLTYPSASSSSTTSSATARYTSPWDAQAQGMVHHRQALTRGNNGSHASPAEGNAICTECLHATRRFLGVHALYRHVRGGLHPNLDTTCTIRGLGQGQDARYAPYIYSARRSRYRHVPARSVPDSFALMGSWDRDRNRNRNNDILGWENNWEESESESLLENTSIICTLLWRRAQATRLEEVGVERRAAAQMGELMGWAETVAFSGWNTFYTGASMQVARCLGGTASVHVAGAGVGASGSGTGSGGGRVDWREVMAAARALCGFLGDEGALGRLRGMDRVSQVEEMEDE